MNAEAQRAMEDVHGTHGKRWNWWRQLRDPLLFCVIQCHSVDRCIGILSAPAVLCAGFDFYLAVDV